VRPDTHEVYHPNGNLVIHLPFFEDHPSLRLTPATDPWDMHHRVTLLSGTRPSNIILSRHESSGWTNELLRNQATESAWLHGFRDQAPIQFARALARARKAELKRAGSST
jgi:hypothetical protein